MRRRVRLGVALLLGSGLSVLASAPMPAAAEVADPLLAGFRDPPASARPRTWWHWLNGNVTERGILADLAWMKRIGLGGIQVFDASLATPQVVDRRLIYMTPEWNRAMRLAVTTARAAGLEFAIPSSPGWSETGGPWVQPADGMKKLVWSELDVAGGRAFAGALPPLPDETGPYGRVPFFDPAAAFSGEASRVFGRGGGQIAVLAYPVDEDAAAPVPVPAATTGTGTPLDGAALAAERPDGGVAIPKTTSDAPARVILTYPRAVRVQAATLLVPGAVPPFGQPAYLPVLEARVADGWRRLASVPLANVPTTVAFPAVAASVFRLTFVPNPAPPADAAPPAPGAVVAGIFPSGGDGAIHVTTLALSAEPRVDRFEAKAGFATVRDYGELTTDAPDLPAAPPGRVVDLTAGVGADGVLRWTPPPGRWRVVRLGWSLLGTTNHPATREATGLEVDKYDAGAVGRYMTAYIGNYRRALGPELVGGGPGSGAEAGGVNAFLTDSIESGDANWTPALLSRFRAMRGYDPTPWLPALIGAVIGSRSASDAFLWDWRRTLADLLASEHYGTVAAAAHAAGLTVYGEALEDGRPQLGDDTAMRAYADVPMAAMWAFPHGGQPRPTLVGDILGAASVAHIRGRPFVAAESFTSIFAPWAYAPADLRPVADLEFALGVNRPVIHTSVHQPRDDRQPGLSLAVFGQYFTRHETWAEMAGPWIDYLSRTSFLLQQGHHVADIAYFYGEDTPLTALYQKAPLADVPVGRGFDFVGADTLVRDLRVRHGDLVSGGGARYRALYLGGTSARMTLPVLRRIAALAEAGATVIGDAPTGSPALGDDAAAYRVLASRLWPGGAEARVGLGRVIAGHDVEVVGRRGLPADFDPGTARDVLLFQHRRTADADIYFVHNRSQRAISVAARFRTAGRAAELWRADDGSHRPLPMLRSGNVATVPIEVAGEDSFFVVFRDAPARVAPATPAPGTAIARMQGPWQVSFQPGRGAPAAVTMAALAPLEASADAGIRYFSGVARYAATFTVPRGAASPGATWLDLGRVGDVAEVRVNGREVGTAWHAPYRLAIPPGVLRAGSNEVEVRVADLWVNRLIGDARAGAAKVAFTIAPTYRPDAPLRPSGLIGPVTLLGEAAR